VAEGLVSLYHRLPWRLRSLAASLRGRHLQRLRYGAFTDALVAEAHVRERWTEAQWMAWEGEQLSALLHRAATKVPYYRTLWAARRREGDRRSPELLEHWPILSKEALRADPEAFVADDCDRRRMVHDHTSGTTGSSLSIWFSRDAVRLYYALFEARWRGWAGVTRHDRWAIIGGQLVTPVRQQRPPFWVWNAGMRQLYMSSYHLAPQHVGACLDALVQYRVRYILGYSSSLHALARGALDAGRSDVRLAVVITNAEPLYAHQREAIEAAFGCEVRETYGMGEAVAAASQCGAGSLHLWPEVGKVEVFSQDSPVPRGVPGDLVCTGFLNRDMPLIRYRVGDVGRLSADVTPCACGRALPRLDSIEGRVDDVLYTADGRRVGRLDPVFKAGIPVREAQIIQETLQQVRVRFVPTAEFRKQHGAAIIDRVRDRMGPVTVVLEALSEIPRGRNGKFRAVLCALSPEERAQVARAGAASEELVS
jgi:phenylacetate-CoA ligase